MKRYRRTALPQYIILLLIILVIIGIGFLSKFVMESVPFLDYFALPWAATRSWLLEGSNPYGADITQVALTNISESGYLARLPEITELRHPIINLFFYLPFSLIPYFYSRILWMTILFISVILLSYYAFHMIRLKPTKIEIIGLIILSVIWLPSLYGILTGQLSILIMLIMVVSLYLISVEKFQAAGFLLALVFGSLPTSLFLIIYVFIYAISRRKWSIITASLSGVAFLIIVSLLMYPSWLLNWFGVIFNLFEDLDWVQTPLMTLASFLPGINRFLSIFFHATLGVYLLFMWINTARQNNRNLNWNAAAILIISFIFHIQADLTLLILLIPSIFMIFHFSQDRWKIVGVVISWIMVLAITVGSWLPIIEDPDFTRGISSLGLQIGLPLFLLLAMLWIRWWAIKIPRLPSEN